MRQKQKIAHLQIKKIENIQCNFLKESFKRDCLNVPKFRGQPPTYLSRSWYDRLARVSDDSFHCTLAVVRDETEGTPLLFYSIVGKI